VRKGEAIQLQELGGLMESLAGLAESLSAIV